MLYPAVTRGESQEDGHLIKFVRSSAKGQEVRVKLKLNTSPCRPIIGDGQRRAMALRALYRNMTQDWEDKNKAPHNLLAQGAMLAGLMSNRNFLRERHATG